MLMVNFVVLCFFNLLWTCVMGARMFIFSHTNFGEENLHEQFVYAQWNHGKQSQSRDKSFYIFFVFTGNLSICWRRMGVWIPSELLHRSPRGWTSRGPVGPHVSASEFPWEIPTHWRSVAPYSILFLRYAFIDVLNMYTVRASENYYIFIYISLITFGYLLHFNIFCIYHYIYLPVDKISVDIIFSSIFCYIHMMVCKPKTAGHHTFCWNITQPEA